MSTGWIVLGVLVILVLFAFGAYNRLVALSQRVGQAFADIDVQLKQRHDLIPNLLETVKGYAAHERGTLDDVVKARNSAMSAQGPGQVAAAENQLSGALGRLIALSEAYPDLKANANFQQLANELSDLENKIAASRRFFNNAVQEYNTGIQQMPAALFAGMFGSPGRRSATNPESRDSGFTPLACPGMTAPNGIAASWPPTVSTPTSHRTNFVRCCCSPDYSC
jgi:LemA protein